MDHKYPTVAKILVLDTRKFEQWQFWIQQYLQHEHYALWESRRTVTITTEDMQRKKNDVKAPKKRKKNLLKQQYGNFKAERSETLKQTFNRLQVINMAFISSSKHSHRDKDGNTACVSTSSTTFPTASASVATISQDTASAYIASQSNGSQIKFNDINQIDEDDIEEMDIKWSMALLSIRADKAPISQERGRKENYRQGSKAEEKTPKALMAIDGRSDKVKDRVGYNVVPPPAADLYLSPKKDLSWTGLPEFVDDTVTDYSRPSPTVASTSAEVQNKNSTTSEDVASPNTPKPFVKFVKPKDNQSKSKINKHETPKKPQVKYVEQYRHSNKKPNVNGNQRNWNNLKSYQLGLEFVLKKKACFNCGDFSHLANECRKSKQRETTRNNPPVNRKFSTGRRNFPTVNRKFPTASRKFTTGSTKIRTTDMGKKGKAVKPLACCVWNPSQNLSNKGYWDSGFSRHMTGNISYLSDFEPFDEGYVKDM
nr:ribonuclease H-like domain-containing protein [Tanacetum cinerariifolium]